MEGIRRHILNIAKSAGIEKCGFSKGAFVALFPYYVEKEEGNISAYARSLDYHTVIEKKLKPIADELLKLGSEYAEIHIDKGMLDDRRAAYEAGLGFYGKNSMLICREYGSYFFIGQIVHSLEIEVDIPTKEKCMDCGECIRACIGGAITENGFMSEKCVSGISQRRGGLTEKEQKLVIESGLCWGCDVCQRVCPHNRGLKTTAIPEFMAERCSCLEKADLEGLSNREFKESYGKYAFSWRGKNVLIRNLNILSGEKIDE